MMWRAITDSIMDISTQVMGEEATIQSGSSPYHPVRGIFEEATNVDETDGFVDIENYRAFIDFQASVMPFEPTQDDRITIVRSGKTYLVDRVIFDGYARYRCYLKDE